MYGKKRITVTNNGQIVLAGGKSWIPIGRHFVNDGKLQGMFLKPEIMFERTLTPENSIGCSPKNKAELKRIVSEKYAERLTTN
jgi:hypothetical protein